MLFKHVSTAEVDEGKVGGSGVEWSGVEQTCGGTVHHTRSEHQSHHSPPTGTVVPARSQW